MMYRDIQAFKKKRTIKTDSANGGSQPHSPRQQSFIQEVTLKGSMITPKNKKLAKNIAKKSIQVSDNNGEKNRLPQIIKDQVSDGTEQESISRQHINCSNQSTQQLANSSNPPSSAPKQDFSVPKRRNTDQHQSFKRDLLNVSTNVPKDSSSQQQDHDSICSTVYEGTQETQRSTNKDYQLVVDHIESKGEQKMESDLEQPNPEQEVVVQILKRILVRHDLLGATKSGPYKKYKHSEADQFQLQSSQFKNSTQTHFTSVNFKDRYLNSVKSKLNYSIDSTPQQKTHLEKLKQRKLLNQTVEMNKTSLFQDRFEYNRFSDILAFKMKLVTREQADKSSNSRLTEIHKRLVDPSYQGEQLVQSQKVAVQKQSYQPAVSPSQKQECRMQEIMLPILNLKHEKEIHTIENLNMESIKDQHKMRSSKMRHQSEKRSAVIVDPFKRNNINNKKKAESIQKQISDARKLKQEFERREKEKFQKQIGMIAENMAQTY